MEEHEVVKDWMRHDPWELHKISKEAPSRDWLAIVIVVVCALFLALLAYKFHAGLPFVI